MAKLVELLFRAKLEAWRHKMVHISHFLQCEMVLGIVNPLSWIFHAISNNKRCLISMPFLSTYIYVRTLNFFPPAESWLVNSNFPRASRMQGWYWTSMLWSTDTCQKKTSADQYHVNISRAQVNSSSRSSVFWSWPLIRCCFFWIAGSCLVNLLKTGQDYSEAGWCSPRIKR